MIKALLKKQALETLSFFTMGKTGARRGKGAVFGFAFLILYAVFSGGMMFWGIAESFCEAFSVNGYTWLYFSLMGVIATGVGVVGGAFIAKAKLYEAKDNDLLLSMPIPPKYILLSRVLGLYAFILLFQALALVPTILVYFITVEFSILTLLFGLVALFTLTVGTTALCCLLGFLIACLTSRLPMKNLVTMVLTIGFLVAYFVAISKLTEGLSYFISNGEEISSVMETALYPFAAFGKGVAGDALQLLAFVAIFGALFTLVFLLISRTYLRLATRNRGERKAKYKGETGVQRGAQFALFKKEFLRYIKSPVYMLNASMGSILAILYAVFSLIDGSLFGLFGEGVFAGDTTLLTATLIVCALTGMNTLTACSVSLEGDSLWVIRSLPVRSWDVLKAKLYLHISICLLPLLFCGISVGVGMGLAFWEILLLLAVCLSFIIFVGVAGLMLNLKFPNLKWTNETVAVKQGVATMIAMFGTWGVVLLACLLWLAVGEYFVAWLYVLVWTFLILGAVVALVVWLKKRGVQVFESL